jgi:hypothetical protein
VFLLFVIIIFRHKSIDGGSKHWQHDVQGEATHCQMFFDGPLQLAQYRLLKVDNKYCSIAKRPSDALIAKQYLSATIKGWQGLDLVILPVPPPWRVW